ncbi:MAG: PhzF family phenazine biosynthesis protein [Bacteroidetes bacterium]|jgi:PhzF family phenazine biosynthesis protein|nr:PhzF family phenazine biosynthesis protein [Bacteroidota bacterium]MBT4399786.1 PhzF family phenazine biosynthesis protein [Bacteroidota bacterium]MBT4410311.1 PhzF family phenazine biosynthesis protein [Bacteroidota bacterium]MBT5427999.1 PhzF family phenazine biosynthesis protein [Bacteroidota bacterium]MBT7092796.1 PhzF family phenazine biosynthesis protein [Bacteroidota bacterium]
MQTEIYQVDAFTSNTFGGNPAAVCPLEEWLPKHIMQSVAAENNLAETAFFVAKDEGFEIRWFTPKIEVDLCGHATLAASWVLFKHLNYSEDIIKFSSRSGELLVSKKADRIILDFPADFCDPVEAPQGLFQAIGQEPLLCYQGKTDYLLIYQNQKVIENLKPDFAALAKVEARGIIVSAKGDAVDFVSRFFAPQVGINEDPVTGSAHTTLIPYWSRELVKTEMHALQISERGGDLMLKMKGNRVEIAGKAITYLQGHITIPD